MRSVKHKSKRWVALGACICFVATLFPDAHAALPSIDMAVKAETPRVLNIDIPTELATVDEWYQAPSKSKPKLIVHIQDAHANYEAQTKIRDVIKYLNTNYGFKTILVEGAASELDPNILKLFPDQDRNLKLVDELAKIGEVTGAEMFLVENSDAAKGMGIEKPELYRKNFDALQKVYSEDEFVSGFFEAYEKKLGQISSRSFGPRMIQALAEWRKFESGHRDFLPFVSKLAELSKKVLEMDLGVLYSQIEWPQLTRLLVLQRVEKELEQTHDRRPTTDVEEGAQRSALSVKQQAELEKQNIIDLMKVAQSPEGLIRGLENFNEKSANLNRIGSSEVRQASAPRALMEALVEEGAKFGLNIRDYPAFAKYAGYLILRGEIVPAELFEEIKKLFDLILESLVKEAPSAAMESTDDLAARKRLLLLHRDEMLARKLLKLELTHDEWLAVLNRQDRFYPDDLNRRMLEQLGQNTRVKETGGEEASQMKKLNEAFRAAFTFYSAAVNRDTFFFQRTQEVLAQTDKAILITGGFHAEGMKYFFRKYDINYGTLTPRITQEFTNEQYRKVMMTGVEKNKAEITQQLQEGSSAVEESDTPKSKKAAKENYLGAESLIDPLSDGLVGGTRSEVRRNIVQMLAVSLGLPKIQQETSLAAPAQVAVSRQPRSIAVRFESVSAPQGFLSVLEGQRALIGAGIGIFGLVAAYLAALSSPILLILAIPFTASGMIYGFDQYFKAQYLISNATKAGSVELTDRLATSSQTEVPVVVQRTEVAQVDAEPLTFTSVLTELEVERAKSEPDAARLADLVAQLVDLAGDIEEAKQAQNVLRDLRVKYKNQLNPSQSTNLIMKVAQLAVKLNQFQQAQKLYEREEIVVTAKAPREAIFAALSPEDRGILKRMAFDDLENQIIDAKDLSASQAVAILITYGFISDKDRNAAKNLAILASLAVTKIAPQRVSELAEMVRAFFPEMVSSDLGYLGRIIDANGIGNKLDTMRMQAVLNPKMEFEVVVFGERGPMVEDKALSNLRIRYAKDFNSAASLVTSKGAMEKFKIGTKVLMVVPEGKDFRKLASQLNLQIVQEENNHEKNLEASVAMVVGAQNLARNVEASVDEDGIEKAGKNWRITKPSLSRLKDIWQRFQAALQVMQSA